MIYVEDETIPPPLYDALVDSDKEYGDEVKEFLKGKKYEMAISVTSLNTPIQKQILTSRHHKEIYVDPLKDCWHSMMGSVVHWVLEKYAAKSPRYFTEFREEVMLNVDGKQVCVHGKFDLYDRETFLLQDWKLTNASNMIYPKTHFELQLNVLKYILESKGYKVRGLQDIYLFPHLDKTKFNNPEYPRIHAKTVDVPIMPRKEIEDYIKSRVKSQLTEREKPDKLLTPCTDEERWVRGSFFAGYERKKGGKKGEIQEFSSRSSVKGDNAAELIAYRDSKGLAEHDFFIKEYRGEAKGCNFCKGAPFCHQRQHELIEQDKQQNQQQ